MYKTNKWPKKKKKKRIGRKTLVLNDGPRTQKIK